MLCNPSFMFRAWASCASRRDYISVRKIHVVIKVFPNNNQLLALPKKKHPYLNLVYQVGLHCTIHLMKRTQIWFGHQDLDRIFFNFFFFTLVILHQNLRHQREIIDIHHSVRPNILNSNSVPGAVHRYGDIWIGQNAHGHLVQSFSLIIDPERLCWTIIF